MFVMDGEGSEFLKSEKNEQGKGGSSLSPGSPCEKNCLIFQIANRVLSSKLLGSF